MWDGGRGRDVTLRKILQLQNCSIDLCLKFYLQASKVMLTRAHPECGFQSANLEPRVTNTIKHEPC